jgi:hypothetical protein
VLSVLALYWCSNAVTYTHLNCRLVGCSSKAKKHVAEVETDSILHECTPPGSTSDHGCRNYICRAAAVFFCEWDEYDASYSEADELYSLSAGKVLESDVDIFDYWCPENSLDSQPGGWSVYFVKLLCMIREICEEFLPRKHSRRHGC